MHISRKHNLGKEEVRRRVEAVAESLAAEYGAKIKWDGDDLVVNGIGLDGRFSIHDDRVDINAKLGFGMKMLEPAIRSSIEEVLDKHLD